MKDWYFYQDKGRTQGPLSLEDLKTRVREGRLRLFDLIYKEGEPGWRMALEHPDLRGEFKQAGGNTAERPWVCLHRKNDETFEFVTLGPFSDAEVRQAIAAGHLSYGDYAWKQDFTEWMRLGSLEEFNPRAASLNRAAQAKPAREETPEQLLRDVVEMKRARTTTVKDVPPTGASGPDLTKSEDDVATRIVSSRELEAMSAPPPPPDLAVKNAPKTKVFQDMSFKPPRPEDEATRIVRKARTDDEDATRIVPRERTPESTRIVDRTRVTGSTVPRISTRGPVTEDDAEPTIIERRPLMDDEPLPEEPLETKGNWRLGPKRFSTDWAIVIGLVALLMVSIVVLSKRSVPTPEIPPPVPVLETLEANGPVELRPPSEDGKAGPDALPAPATKPDVPPPAPPPPPKPRAPTTLVLSTGTSGNAAKIEVRSDGTPEFPVFLQIIGLPGQVAGGASYYRYVKVATTGNAQDVLTVPDLELAPGRYRLRAETANLQREADLAIGTGETSYKQAVARARKLNASAIWSERLALFRQARALEQRLASGQLGAKGFEALAQVKKSTGANYIFFEDWWEMKEIVREARQQKITLALRERARRLRERMAAFSVWRLR